MKDSLGREADHSTARKPAKPWRVYGSNPLYEDYTSQPRAYEAVRELNRWGHAAEVWHWEDGGWRLYERIEAGPELTPVASIDDAVQRGNTWNRNPGGPHRFEEPGEVYCRRCGASRDGFDHRGQG